MFGIDACVFQLCTFPRGDINVGLGRGRHSPLGFMQNAHKTSQSHNLNSKNSQSVQHDFYINLEVICGNFLVMDVSLAYCGSDTGPEEQCQHYVYIDLQEKLLKNLFI